MAALYWIGGICAVVGVVVCGGLWLASKLKPGDLP